MDNLLGHSNYLVSGSLDLDAHWEFEVTADAASAWWTTPLDNLHIYNGIAGEYVEMYTYWEKYEHPGEMYGMFEVYESAPMIFWATVEDGARIIRQNDGSYILSK